ncbi:CpaF family protein [Tessaracoccus sp. ZS01]|uniref:CpaF family protein n=1 Tax=Tessaracoccus sp. ZS01 TaxID=1906324 RepID=UPI00096D7F00|nr:CpaF/VirB11 family protein [Tessaracoccus sp. ZS01]MCG6567609.1 CpaF family protein [Tessaracoccus sp. ZS01]OMG55964.1 secretion protein [Tessaracoccus sp. ZS01]
MSVHELPPLSGALGRLGASPAGPMLPTRAARAASSPATPPRMPGPPSTVDWQLVVTLRREAAEAISLAGSEWLTGHGQPMPEADRRVQGRSVIRRVVHAHAQALGDSGEALWPMELETRYADAVESAIFGYGRLQPLFEIPDAENIEIHGCDSVMIQYGDGRRVAHPAVADSDEELVDAIRFLGETASPPRPFDDLHPTMTLALGSRFRLHAIGFGLSYRPSVVIRQHRLTDVTLSDLAETGMLPPHVARLLQSAVLARKSVVISGDQGAGKTTLLRALIAAIHPNERFGTLETDYELLTHLLHNRRNVLALQARVGMGETSGGVGVGDYTVADLIPEALRQNLTRLVVGEVRGAEAGAMFEALQSGAGVLSTTHSHSATSTIDRLAARVAQGRVLSIEDAMNQIAHHIDFLVHVQLTDDTWRGGQRRRFVSEVRQLTGSVEAGRPATHLVYRAATGSQQEWFQPEAAMSAELAEFDGASLWG